MGKVAKGKEGGGPKRETRDPSTTLSFSSSEKSSFHWEMVLISGRPQGPEVAGEKVLQDPGVGRGNVVSVNL